MNKIMYTGLVLLIINVASSSYCMTEDIKKQIDAAKKKLQQEVKSNPPHSHESIEANLNYNEEVATIVLNSGNNMTDNEKLKHLYGDARWNDRKSIIRKMVGLEKQDPNIIVYSVYTPLKESVLYEDEDFVRFLLDHGARPNDNILKISTSAAIKALISQALLYNKK